MLKVGLTGGIGCGKSAAVNRFRSYGVSVVDADIIARQVVARGEPILEVLPQYFGYDILTTQGELNRTVLREIVFSDPQKLATLESLLDPLIRERIEQAIKLIWDTPYLLLDIPLLIEKGYKSLCNRIIVVDCLPYQQIARVVGRDHTSERLVMHIMQKQASREMRLQQATDILDNTRTLANLETAVDELHAKLLKLSSSC